MTAAGGAGQEARHHSPLGRGPGASPGPGGPGPALIVSPLEVGTAVHCSGSEMTEDQFVSWCQIRVSPGHHADPLG